MSKSNKKSAGHISLLAESTRMPTSNTSDQISIYGIPLLIPDRPEKAGNFMMWNSKLYDILKSQKDIHLAANLLNPQLVNGVLTVDH
jgi:hypothetical protein